MDSDDNCLVIDETIADMEVSSTSETPAPKDVCEIEIHDENEADSSVSTTPLNLSTKKSKHNRDDDGHGQGKEREREKEKDRHREKRRSKDERRKTVTPSSSEKLPVKASVLGEKHRSHKQKANCIRLTDAMFNSKTLNITAPKHQFYSMRFSYRRGFLSAELPSVYPATPTFPDLTLTQLLNWPDIKVSINLDFLKFSREIKQNCKRDLIFGDEILIGVDTQNNHTETRYIQKAPTTRTYPLVSKDVLDAYISTLLDAAPQYKVGPTKLLEIKRAFRQMLNDIASVPFSSIQTRIPHSRFLNQQKYFCIFNPQSSDKSGQFEVRLREHINPEVIFEIERCGFLTDQVDQWQDQVFKHLEEVLLKPKDALKERFKRCLVIKCVKCNETFEGALLAVTLKNHIKQTHLVEKQWTCVKCLRSWDQFELLDVDWKHDCETGV